MKKETESEITKIQEIFLRQQNDVKEMQEGTISEVRKTKNLLEQLESKTSDLIQLQKGKLTPDYFFRIQIWWYLS